MTPHRNAYAIVLALCTAVSVLPLWVGTHLPAVDAPQHLFLIHVLGNLDDPSLPYRDIYVSRPGLTYVTFYYTVRGLAALVGVETALKIWLTLVLGAIPLSLALLLRALGRSKWLALLACPLIFTDNFYWGLISFQSSLPFTLLVLAFFVQALEAEPGSRRAKLALGGTATSLLLLQLTHAAGMIFPAAALPLLLLVTPSDWERRKRAVLALVPGVAVFLAWLLSGVNKGRQFGKPGEPWKASGPLFDLDNFVFHPLGQKLGKLPELLTNGFWDWADRPALYGLAALALLAIGLAIKWPQRSTRPLVSRLRPGLLLLLALAFYFFLPADITGYMYQIYPRYSQLAALLAIPVLPFPSGPSYKIFAGAAAALALYSGINLAVLFHRFDTEAQGFEELARHIAPRSRIMHLVLDRNSRFASHAVYLHYAALAALRVDGVPSFSLATDPSFPVGYRDGAKPPASPWEWQPQRFDWKRQASWYDYYLVRGDAPVEQLFRREARRLELVTEKGRWRLYRKKTH